ncbi:MAG: hypothetical protein ACRC0V_11910 [Fusobacteriaceae bacterium]|uniref:hypothetical protein n=1 Tax=Romboutsia sp. TaxID=1965302 RepID=UPI003F31BB7A
MKSIKDSYKLYSKNIKNKISLSDYLSINNEYNKFLLEKVFIGEEVTLPSQLGTLKVLGKKQKLKLDKNGNMITYGLSVDWVRTKKLWDNNETAKEEKRLVYHLNEHSGQVRYKFFWSKKNVFVKNKGLYALRMSRTNKRTVHKKILEGQDYITIDRIKDE